ncbi:MAG: DUF2339 domain-containing protein [Rubrobacteraceae bacterium]
MMGSGDQKLVERIESLEEEVEEQRLLLRCALGDFEREADGSDPISVSEKKAEDQKAKTRQAGAGRLASDTLPWTTATQRLAGAPSEEGDSGKPIDERGDLGNFGALADLFRLRGWEWWLNKIGIGLLLFGVVFLFKFSVDQGWLTPKIRVGFGLTLGAVLIWLGLRVYGERRAFSQVVLGGGIGTFYITGFAAFQLYALVPYALAFTFLIVVTLLAFALSIRQGEAALSLIGAAGGFGTPFLLYNGYGGLGGLVLYTALILTGIAAIYLYNGWRSLLFFSVIGVWMVLLAGYTQAAVPIVGGGRTFLQAGAVFSMLVLWLVPVAREVIRQRRPGLWPVPGPGKLIGAFFDNAVPLHPSLPAHLLSGIVPLIALTFTQEIWDLSKQPLGWIALCGAAVYALASEALRRVENEGRLYYTNALAALLLFTLGVVLVLKGDALFFTLMAEATILHFVSRRLSDKFVSALGHGLFLTVGIWLAGRIFFGVEEIFFFGSTELAFLNLDALLDLTAIALAFGVSTIFAYQRFASIYRITAHVALLGLLFRKLIGFPSGDTLAFLSWAAYASALLLLSRRYPQWGTVVGSHALWIVVGLWFAGRLDWGMDLKWVPLFNVTAIADLAVICLALLTSTLLSPGTGLIAYRIVAHVAVLAWLWRELGAFPDGAAYVTVSWGVYAAGLLVLGLRRSSNGLVRVGIITLFLVVGKLFLVDLAWVGAIWRILLFLGFGGLFLVLSYYLQALWKTRTGPLRESSGSS